MDGESFDRLSVVVHRLRDQATRRGALRLLIGGSAAAVAGVVASETDAKKNKNKKHKNCKGYGGRCGGNKDCCNGSCRNGFCWYTGNGGGNNGGRYCNGIRCQNGWRCCNFQGWQQCLPDTHVACGGGGYCDFGWGQECGWNGPVRQCCQNGWKCCGNGRCCPDGWYCGNVACEAWQTADVDSESAETMPFGEPQDVTSGGDAAADTDSKDD